MKKLLLVLSLCCAATMPTVTQCGIFDSAINLLKSGATTLFEKGKKLITDKSDTILNTIKEQGGPLLDKALNFAKEQIFGKVKEEAVAEEQAIQKQAEEIIAKNPGLTSDEKQTITREAGIIAQKNKVALEQVATEAIEKKRAALKQSMYDRFGKGTPTTTTP
jgi:hypothetical protein